MEGKLWYKAHLGYPEEMCVCGVHVRAHVCTCAHTHRLSRYYSWNMKESSVVDSAEELELETRHCYLVWTRIVVNLSGKTFT